MVSKLFKEFLGLGKPSINDHFRKFSGKENFIIYAEGNELTHNGFEGPFSFKYNFSGKAYYSFDGKRFAITQNNYLFLNANQFYTCENERHSKIKSLIIFFATDFFQQSVYNVTQNSDKLLDNFDFYTKDAINFFERITIPTSHTLFLIKKIADGVSFDYEMNYINELLYQLIGELTKEQIGYSKIIEGQPAYKRSTKIELFKRTAIAKDYIVSNYHQPIHLDILSRLVQMAPCHFLRVFKHNFHETPYQLITRLRLSEAKEMLSTANIPITEISEKLGFENLCSFTRIFTKYVKQSPSSFRKLSK